MSEKKVDETGAPDRGFFRELGRSLANGVWDALRWILVGGILGAIALGSAGGYYFGWSGLGIGLLVGAIAGALAALWLASEI